MVSAMSDVVSAFPTWLTYHQVAERLGLRTTGAAASRARRAKWPKRTRNDTLEVEVCVPAEILVAGPARPRERREEESGDDAQTTAEAVAAAVAPLQSIIESLSGELNVARNANDALREQVAEFRGRSAAVEAALERGLAERCELQRQLDHARREYQSIQERVVLAHGETLDERRRRHATEDLMARLKHELSELKQTTEQRRWWRWR
jgi:chromosome segregation ATPase